MMENHITLLSLWCSVFVVFLFMAIHVHGQSLPSTEGYISLYCGLLDNENYTDSVTKLIYTSDAQYIDTGLIKNMSADYIDSSSARYKQTVRFFPDGDRNCYTIENISSTNNYFVRATFMYGNYDGLKSVQPGKPILFDLYIGANLWRKVNISDASKEYMFETLTDPTYHQLFICLVNTKTGVPFISALEIRPMESIMYFYYESSSIMSFMYRFNYGGTNQAIRYPIDPYDRIWQTYPYNSSSWTGMSTNRSIDGYSSFYAAPLPVLQTAVTPISSPNLTVLQWKSETSLSNPKYYVVIYIADLQPHTINSTREFIVNINGRQWPYFISSPYNALSLSLTIIYSADPLDKSDEYIVSLEKTELSTMPPLINAIEVYAIIENKNPTTYSYDVDGINAIKKNYGLTRNWIGDPCFPKELKWDGLNCSLGISSSSYGYITTINLTSSELNGEISEAFKSFKSLENLDLSCNNLTGPVPEFLANTGSLVLLNLAGNSFTEPIPTNLIKQANNGRLTLILESDRCSVTVRHSKSKKKTMVIASVASAASAVLLAILIFAAWKIRRKRQASRTQVFLSHSPLHVEFRQFTYEQLKLITNNFFEVIGKGGFGNVYLGLMDEGIKVAVKVPNIATTMVMKQFRSEARNLMQVHHKNLVTLVGYCTDENFYGLVYEYMPHGSLYDHLSRKASTDRVLSWGERLRIAFDAAQGLDYLHTGCMIAHRDVKTSNILLGQNFEAKLADFGLSKLLTGSTGLSTISQICGTPGYIDPEAHVAPLSEKSDVYSFGVVLLELITGEPPIKLGRENINLIGHVNCAILDGNISSIADSRFESNYNEEIMWRLADLALRCTKKASIGRPIMAEVVTELRDCLSEENRWRNETLNIEEVFESQAISIHSSLIEAGPSVR